MDKRRKLCDPEVLAQKIIENREKRLAKKPLPDLYFIVKSQAVVTILGPRGGHRGTYVNPEAFPFHLDQVVTVGSGPRGSEIVFESSPPWENNAVRLADVEIKTAAEVAAFMEDRKRARTQTS